MARQKWMSKSVKTLIVQEALKNRDMPRMALAADLVERIARMGEPRYSEETIAKDISQVWNHEPYPEDEPWTMASLAKSDYDLPPASIPSVLGVWRYAVNTHEAFTIRQAKWASRLHKLFDDATLLWFWSRTYALDEQAWAVSELEPDTFVADAAIAMHPWERATLLHTDFRKGKLIRYACDRVLTEHEDLLHLPDYAGLFGDEEHATGRALDMLSAFDEVAPLHSLELRYEARMVYLRWLVYLTKGSNWNQLAPEEVVHLILRLRQWVIDQQTTIFDPNPPHDTISADDLLSASMKIHVQPDELLKLVGHPYAYWELGEKPPHTSKRGPKAKRRARLSEEQPDDTNKEDSR